MLILYHRYMHHRMKLLHGLGHQPLTTNPTITNTTTGRKTITVVPFCFCPAYPQARRQVRATIQRSASRSHSTMSSVRVLLTGSVSPPTPDIRFLRIVCLRHDPNRNPSYLLLLRPHPSATVPDSASLSYSSQTSDVLSAQ